MPTYEYKCKDCNAMFSILRPMSASAEETKCPVCGSITTERMISLFSSGRSNSSCSSNGTFT